MPKWKDPQTGEEIVNRAGLDQIQALGGISAGRSDEPTRRFDDEDERTHLVRPASTSPEQLVVGWLVVWEGPGRGKSHVVGLGRNTIGRGPQCDLRIDHGDKAISIEGKIAVIFDRKSFQCHIQDLGARNPVYVNDEPLLQPRALNDGDILEIGATKLMFVPFCKQNRVWS